MPMNGIRDRRVAFIPAPVDGLDLDGRRLVVVGGTNGLGRAIAHEAVDRGAETLVVGRTFRDAQQERLSFVESDLSSMREATRLGRELPVEDHDVVLFTLGISASKSRRETVEHVETDMAVSHLSRFAVLQGMASRLGTERPYGMPRPRVFVMGAPGGGILGNPDDLNSEDGYRAVRAHMNTVAANEALALGGAERLAGPDYFGLNPGLVKTDIRSNYLGAGSLTHRATEALIGVFGQSPHSYARRIVPLLFAPGLEGHSGTLFNNKAQPVLPSRGFDKAHVDRFLAASESLLRRALD